MANLDACDFQAIGCVVVVLNGLENLLVRLESVNYEPERTITRDFHQKQFQVAVGLSYTSLLLSLKRRLEGTKKEQADAQILIDSWLTPKTDSFGRKIRMPLQAWRDSIHHGMFVKLPNGNILLDFSDRNSFSPLLNNPSLIQNNITKETNARELFELARSVAMAIQAIGKIFDPNGLMTGVASDDRMPPL